MPRKIKLLVAVHLALGIAPVFIFLVPPEYLRIALAVLVGMSFGQWMLLAFWAGLGTNGGAMRVAGSAIGALHLSIWPCIGMTLSRDLSMGEPVTFAFAFYLALCSAMLVTFGGIFLFIRRGIAELRLTDNPAAIASTRYQFSVMQLLLTTSVVAVVLGLLRWSGSDNDAMWHSLATSLVTLVALVANVVTAPWAVLSAGPIRWRLLVVLATTIVLGFTMSYSVLWGFEPSAQLPQLFAIQTLIAALWTSTIVLSLLVVRACGFRLIRKAHPLASRAVLEQ